MLLQYDLRLKLVLVTTRLLLLYVEILVEEHPYRAKDGWKENTVVHRYIWEGVEKLLHDDEVCLWVGIYFEPLHKPGVHELGCLAPDLEEDTNRRARCVGFKVGLEDIALLSNTQS